MKNNFPEGTYIATITDIYFGLSKLKKSPYISIQFESESFVKENPFYLSGYGLEMLKSCLKCIEIEINKFDINSLLGRELVLKLEKQTKGNSEISFTGINIVKFDKVSNHPNLLKDNIDEDYNWDVDATPSSVSEIFGCDVEDVADSMGIDPSEVTEEDIRNYSGY